MNILAISLLLGFAQNTDLLSETEAAAIKARTDIKTIVVSLRVNTEEFGTELSKRKGEMTIWSDANRRRSDHTDHLPGLGEMNGVRKVECFHCLRSGTRFTYYDTSGLQSSCDSIPSSSFESTGITFDPRLLGYRPSEISILRHGRLDGTIGSTSRVDASCRNELLGSVNCRVISFTHSKDPDDKRTVWCDPSRGNHPIRFKLDGSNRVVEYDIELQSVAGGYWYPKKIHYTRTVGGKLQLDETIEVDSVKINEPIPDDVFTLKGIGMREDTHVHSRADSEQNWMWHNGKYMKYFDVKREVEGIPESPKATPLVPPGDRPYWLYALAVTLLLATGVALWFAFRKTKRG